MGEIDATHLPDGDNPAALPTITVCRGCCCGTIGKHPGVDHDGQLARLRTAVTSESQVRVSQECLGQCERSNVMVVAPSRLGRVFGGRPTWIGHVLDERTLNAVTQWLTSAGPGLAAVPEAVRAAVFVPPRPGAR